MFRRNWRTAPWVTLKPVDGWITSSTYPFHDLDICWRTYHTEKSIWKPSWEPGNKPCFPKRKGTVVYLRSSCINIYIHILCVCVFPVAVFFFLIMLFSTGCWLLNSQVYPTSNAKVVSVSWTFCGTCICHLREFKGDLWKRQRIWVAAWTLNRGTVFNIYIYVGCISRIYTWSYLSYRYNAYIALCKEREWESLGWIVVK